MIRPLSGFGAAAAQNADTLAPSYAESVEISGLSDDSAEG